MKVANEKEIEAIRAQYTATEKTKLDELKAMDRRVKLPAEIFAYSFGIVGSLILGTGMSLAMKVIGGSMPLGIAIGVLGIGMVSANYFLYKLFLKKRKNKYGKEIVALSDELLNK